MKLIKALLTRPEEDDHYNQLTYPSDQTHMIAMIGSKVNLGFYDCEIF